MSAAGGAPLELFAVCAPGVEEVLAAELRSLGVQPTGVEPGGVTFTGGREAIYRSNLWLRTASRVIARVGEFHARMFSELERHAKRQAWDRFLDRGRPVRLRVTCRKSRLYHSGAVAERVAGAIEANLGRASTFALATGDGDGDGGEEDTSDAQLIIVRLLHDRCTLSVDTSGQLLHMRGYRLATAKAPLRETLAAALLIASGWDTRAPLLDPMCGAGTISIEGALMARRVAPGVNRRFAFMEWPEVDAAQWERLLEEASARALSRARGPIQASDRDAGAIAAALANAERAGVSTDIAFANVALSGIEPPPSPSAPGWLVTNPPYGLRVGERDRLRNLYAQLGNVARRKCPGWTLALLSADAQLERHVGVRFQVLVRTRNGGVAVRMLRGEVPGLGTQDLGVGNGS